MSKQRRIKKTQMPKAVEKVRTFILERIIGIIVVTIFIFLAFFLAKAFLERSDYFRVRSVDAKGAAETSLIAIRSDILKHYKNTNIFKIDLKRIAENLEPKYPDAKYIIVKRVLPDKLLVDLAFRVPVAILSGGRDYLVDNEGVILVNMDPARLRSLPVISGVDSNLAGKSHKKNQSKSLTAAIELVQAIKKARFLQDYNVRHIDASDLKSISFNLQEGGPAIIIGYENFEERLAVLKDTLKRESIALDKVNYIDLRFKDIAISPK